MKIWSQHKQQVIENMLNDNNYARENMAKFNMVENDGLPAWITQKQHKSIENMF